MVDGVELTGLNPIFFLCDSCWMWSCVIRSMFLLLTSAKCFLRLSCLCFLSFSSGSRLWIRICLNQALILKYFAWIALMGRVFANGLGDLGSIPGRVIPKTLKMILDASLLNTQQYNIPIKDNVEQSRKRNSVLS